MDSQFQQPRELDATKNERENVAKKLTSKCKKIKYSEFKILLKLKNNVNSAD